MSNQPEPSAPSSPHWPVAVAPSPPPLPRHLQPPGHVQLPVNVHQHPGHVAPYGAPQHYVALETVRPAARVAAWLLEGLLVIVTLGIGWIIWAATTAGAGQTPAKRLLGQQVVAIDTLRPVGMGRMFWMRYFIAGIVVSIAFPLTLGILVLMPLWDSKNQNLWDKVSATYVVPVR